MQTPEVLADIGKRQHKGEAVGIFSVCSSNDYVLKATLQLAKNNDQVVLIEATSNQVNQDGGYTGMTPSDYRSYLDKLMKTYGCKPGQVILGGDHLGPNPWKHEPAEVAMEKAKQMVRDYTHAGIVKLHLDASMNLGDDGKAPISPRLIAGRTAELAKAAEEAFDAIRKDLPDAMAPVYVIGTEVPVPGGTQEEEDTLQVTTPADFEETVNVTREAFKKQGLESAWERVMAVVVQPGVEFSSHSIHEYDAAKFVTMRETLKDFYPLVFEGHSTDYQRPDKLKELVRDGVAVLKVGPELTFALREGIFALEAMERELFPGKTNNWSQVSKVLDQAMVENPAHWQAYYVGDKESQAFDRRFSFSDRCRYYWGDPGVQKAVKQLLGNLGRVRLPLSLISQYMPLQYRRVREGVLTIEPEALLLDCVTEVLRKYTWAVK
ncbi:MAG: class II D-tagatose-bisphosphate aldolase, non-catalytic subunit [Firmicutes bacterium]|nr:class II D-tagatose-bisphosphate aldolase, non-catalytic subunit [Bacillota bacterium]